MVHLIVYALQPLVFDRVQPRLQASAEVYRSVSYLRGDRRQILQQ